MIKAEESGYGHNPYVPEENVRLTHVGAGTPTVSYTHLTLPTTPYV